MRVSLLSLRTVFILIIAGTGCADEKASPEISTAILDGASIAFTESKATDTGSGLELVLADGNNKISILLSGTTSDSYTVQNRGGRVATASKAIITVIHNAKVYFGTSGKITVANSNGTLAVQISELTLKTWAGETLTLSDVNAKNIEINQIPDGCRISSYAYTFIGMRDCYHDQDYSFSYNGDGKIARAYGPGSDLSFIYDSDGKLLGYNGIEAVAGGNLLVNLQLSYADTKLVSFKREATPESDSVNTVYQTGITYSLIYDGNKISGANISYNTNNGVSDTYSKTIAYNESNMSQTVSTYEDGAVVTTRGYASFDANKNPYHLLATLMGSDVSFIQGGFDKDFDLFSLQDNNPLSRTIWAGEETFEYTYNANGYPTQIVYTPNSKEYCTSKVTMTLSYDGCQ